MFSDVTERFRFTATSGRVEDEPIEYRRFASCSGFCFRFRSWDDTGRQQLGAFGLPELAERRCADGSWWNSVPAESGRTSGTVYGDVSVPREGRKTPVRGQRRARRSPVCRHVEGRPQCRGSGDCYRFGVVTTSAARGLAVDGRLSSVQSPIVTAVRAGQGRHRRRHVERQRAM